MMLMITHLHNWIELVPQAIIWNSEVTFFMYGVFLRLQLGGAGKVIAHQPILLIWFPVHLKFG